MKRISRTDLWLKAQRKYRNLQRRITLTNDEKALKKLTLKLDHLKRRLISMNRKWRVGIATSMLLAWMAMPSNVQAQEIDLNTLSVSDGFKIVGNATDDLLGEAVSMLGDVNNDGFDDFGVGATGANNTGQVYVIFGSSSTFPSTLDPSTLSSSGGFIIEGTSNGNRTGAAIARAGDINGDGVPDILIGAPNSNVQTGEGYVIFGDASLSGTFALSGLNGSNGFTINGIDSNDETGSAVSSAGDLNGDGFDDLMISAPYADPDGLTDAGEVYIIFGKNTAATTEFDATINLSSLDGTNGFIIEAGVIQDGVGVSIESLGDINEDGRDDIIIGAPFEEGNSEAGKSFVVFGNNSGFASPFELSSLNGSNGFTVNGISANNYAGFVSGAGDINGDGINDFIVGAVAASPNGAYSGQVYIIFGDDCCFDSSFDPSTLNSTDGFIINGIDAGNLTGFPASAGDFNGDGMDDIIISASGADQGVDQYVGEIYVIFGKRSFPSPFELSSLDEYSGIVIKGINADDAAGSSVSGGNDINNDGFDDLIIGAYGADTNGDSSGEAYVIFGRETPTLPSPPSIQLAALDGTNGFVINGENPDDGTGFSVDIIPDINGDNIDDIAVGATRAGTEDILSGDASGQTYIIFGDNSGFNNPVELSSLDGTNGFVINGVSNVDQIGGDVNGAGDINNDGINDIIIGNYAREDDGVADRTFVVFGSSTGFTNPLNLSGLDGSDGFQLASIDTGAGASVDAAGDVNNDGVDDLIIGARYADPNGANSGSAYILFGKDTGIDGNFSALIDLDALSGTDGFVVTGIAAGDRLGQSVSSADINNDGLGDVIIGANNVNSGAGETYIIFGSGSPFPNPFNASTLNGTNGFTIQGAEAEDSSGSTVDSAGDINGDGIDDILIGAPYADGDNKVDIGESYIVFGKTLAFAAVLDLSALDGTDGFAVRANDVESYAGVSVSKAGDFDGDGIDDFLIGTYNTADGETYLVFGKETSTEGDFPSVLNLSQLTEGEGFVVTGIVDGDDVANFLGGGGDINNDGFDDIIIGNAEATPNGNSYAGQSFVIFGTSEIIGGVDNPPSFTSLSTADFSENGTVTILDVNANDGDGGASDTGITYTISGGADQGSFSISTEGLLTFVSPPDFENPTDIDSDNVYELEVTADDGAETTNQALTITVTNVDEEPVFVSQNTADFSENGTVTILDVNANDGDGGVSDTGITYTISGGADQGLFSISTEGLLTFVSPPDFENPSDIGSDNVYELEITANDGAETTNQALTITVTNVDEEPVFVSQNTADFSENGAVTILDVNANDGDGGASDSGITYTISGGADQGLFSISTEGLLTFVSPPDFENPADIGSDNVYELEVTADDGANASEQVIAVTVIDEQENQVPSISDQTFNIDENSPNGTVVGTLVASDPDADALIFSSNIDGNDPFALSNTGEITVENNSLLDFESVDEWSFNVEVDDSNGGTETSALLINVNDIDEVITGIDDVFEGQMIKAFPNPATDWVILEFTLLEKRDVAISLVDLSGSVIRDEALENVFGEFQYRVDLSGLEEGVYVVYLTYGEEQTIGFRVVKE